ncbi:MAG: hypothetical protein GX638_02275 [Crenarchaeota archaeon]|nr:hypothetical protein [Thermoproteota archaeon]
MQKLGIISLRHLAICIIVTIVCTVLAIWAVVVAPVEPAPGVSGLYIAAAVYVPVALWFGVWGSIAGYASCIIMGLYSGLTLEFVLIWALADFFEGFIPLLAYRKFKIKKAKLRKPKITYALAGLLALNVIISAIAMLNTYTELFIATFIAGILILILEAAIEDKKAWFVWLFFGVFIASVASGFFGVGALALFGIIKIEIFPTALFGWILGDIIVLSTIGTILMLTLTPIIQKTKTYVKNYFT